MHERDLDSNTPSDARRPLSRERIIGAAVDFIDESGVARLTMKRLGHMLDVEAMSLYRYVPDKENLLGAVAKAIVEELRDDEAVLHHPTHGWQHFLEHLAHGVRRVALRHPNAFPLVASQPSAAPGLRAPLSNLYWAESFLAALISEGFSDAHAMAAYRTFSGFLLGHLLNEVAPASGQMTSYLPVSLDADQERVARWFPTLGRLHNGPLSGDADREFATSLGALMNLLAAQRASHFVPRTPTEQRTIT